MISCTLTSENVVSLTESLTRDYQFSNTSDAHETNLQVDWSGTVFVIITLF